MAKPANDGFLILFAFLHIWLIGVLPILGVSQGFTIGQADIIEESLPDWLFLVVIWAQIISLLYILVYCFRIAELYLDRALRPELDRKRWLDYVLMTGGPLAYFAYLHWARPTAVVPEMVEVGVITTISMHGVLHVVALVRTPRSDAFRCLGRRRQVLRLARRGFAAALFAVVCAAVYVRFLSADLDLVGILVFHGTLMASIVGSARFYLGIRGSLTGASHEPQS